MDNQNQQLHKIPIGALLIILSGGISFVNAIASYIFGIQYVNYGILGFGAMFLHVLQALALVTLGIHYYNKTSEKLSLLFNAIISIVSIGFIFFLRSSATVAAIEMTEYVNWFQIGTAIRHGSGSAILYIVLLIAFILCTFFVEFKKEGTKLTNILVVSGLMLLSSFWSFFSEDILGIQFAHIMVYVILTLGLCLCGLHKATGKYVMAASKTISKKGFMKIVLVMAIATLIMIPISFALNDTSSKSTQIAENECEFCERDFTDSTNKKYIRKTNMCKNCYQNFCFASGREPKNYD